MNSFALGLICGTVFGFLVSIVGIMTGVALVRQQRVEEPHPPKK